jgi:hypothetical protein
MASKYWIKLYHEILHDRKMAQLRDRLWRRVMECFLLAGEANDDGYLPSMDDMAWSLRADAEQLETELTELVQLGILQVIDGRYHVTKFSQRQEPMAKAEYMRRKRDTGQKAEYYQDGYQPVTNSNADTDIDKIRIDKNQKAPILSAEKITNQELPPEARPNYQHNESRRLIISALSSVCRETFVIGDEKQEQAADALIELGATEADIIAFGPYWAKVDGKPYNGKPYLKSLMQNIKESMAVGKPIKEWGKNALSLE